MKIIITEQQYNKAIDKYLTYVFEPHEEITSKKYPDSIFWMKNGKVISEIEKSRFFWVDEDIWENISIMFSLEPVNVRQLIKEWLEEHYGLGRLTPYKEAFGLQVGRTLQNGRINKLI
jgi:hypothetical protein